MSLMTLFFIWAAVTAVLVILLIYRSTLSMHEDDQLFLDEASSSMRVEQEQLQVRMQRLALPVKIFGAASVLLILVLAGMAIWQRVNQPF